MRKLLATLALGIALAFGAPNAAEAQVGQVGLVNVNVGDVTLFENVAVGVAAQLAVQICAVQVALPANIIGVLVAQVARTGQATACTIVQDDQEQEVIISR